MPSKFKITALHEGQEVNAIYHQGQFVEAAIHQGRLVYYPDTIRVDEVIPTEVRMVTEATGKWFEVGFLTAEPLTGNAATGWTDPGNYCRIQLQQSDDLVAWNFGKFVPSPTGAVEVVEDGVWRWWSRCTMPAYWQETLNDFTLTSDRYGKSITAISLLGADISLPGFPYAMPSQAATLQTHLRAAGFTGATVTSISQPLTAKAKNHTAAGTPVLTVTQSGTNVTAVAFNGATIPLGGYPYSMPSQRATLQTHLRSAGYSGAVVKLHADAWTITLPDVACVGNVRQFYLTITPGDPFPYWDFQGNYQGESADAVLDGEPGNTRDPLGNPLQEFRKQFARIHITPGTRYDGYPNDPTP